jgi:SH3-like domain-containing protein
LRSFRVGWLVVTVVIASILSLPACSRGRHRVLEVAYVSAPQAGLRDQVAAIYNRVGNVKNGERVEVLDREKRFARVRTGSGIEGWIEQRYLVDQKTFEALQNLTQDNQNDPVQAPGAKVAILKRATAEKQSGAGPPPRLATRARAKASAGPLLEDWWLVRDSLGRVGWVLSRMVDVDLPLEIAQYAEGQRFVAFFVLNQVPDNDKGVQREVPQYLCVMTDPHDGLPYDFDQVRVFTWNARKHRYETAYREHGLDGILPVTITKENFDKEGTLPVFILRVKDETGNVSERKYKLNTPIVRRVLSPGEVPARLARKRRR